MRVLVLAAWLLVPVVAAAWHYGPGQERLAADDAAATIAKAERLAKAGDLAAVEQYTGALARLPKERVAESRRVRLERAKCQLRGGQLPEAHAEMRGLVDELAAESKPDAALLADARDGYANAQYYLTWLMRLEGLPRDEWGSEVESARQQYKLLAEQADKAGDAAAAKRHRENLESTVRLARMDLGELQGQPLPCQCNGCCSGKCKSRGKGKMGKKPGEKDARGAGGGQDPERGGH